MNMGNFGRIPPWVMQKMMMQRRGMGGMGGMARGAPRQMPTPMPQPMPAPMTAEPSSPMMQLPQQPMAQGAPAQMPPGMMAGNFGSLMPGAPQQMPAPAMTPEDRMRRVIQGPGIRQPAMGGLGKMAY